MPQVGMHRTSFRPVDKGERGWAPSTRADRPFGAKGELRTANGELRTVNSELRMANREQRTANCELRTLERPSVRSWERLCGCPEDGDGSGV